MTASPTSGRLTEAELTALARAFPPGPAARAVLSSAGFPGEHLPSAFGVTSTEFWAQVAAAVEDGVLADGRRELLAAAARRFPANPVFLADRAFPADPVLPAAGAGVRAPESAPVAVLFVGASPVGARRLRTDREAKAVLRAAGGEGRRVEICPAAEVTDLRRLLDLRPDILHLACHGDGENLVFEDGFGEQATVPAAEVARTLLLYRERAGVRLRALLLGSCHSERAAALFRGAADTVIAHTGPLDDQCAIAFAEWFYRELGRTPDRIADAAVIAARHTTLTDPLCAGLEDGLVVLTGPG